MNNKFNYFTILRGTLIFENVIVIIGIILMIFKICILKAVLFWNEKGTAAFQFSKKIFFSITVLHSLNDNTSKISITDKYRLQNRVLFQSEQSTINAELLSLLKKKKLLFSQKRKLKELNALIKTDSKNQQW